MSQRRTDRRLWLLVSVCLFIALGFVNPLAGATTKSDHSLWAKIGDMANGNLVVIRDMLPGVVCYTFINAIAAALLGWVVQALVVVLRSSWCPYLKTEVKTPSSDRPA
jgi:hypothetical protein